jgi:hypothetical protein
MQTLTIVKRNIYIKFILQLLTTSYLLILTAV